MGDRSRSRDKGKDSRSRSRKKDSRSRSKSQGKTKRPDDYGVDSMKITDDDAAFILGKGGRTKDKIARVSGAEIELFERDLVLEIRGSKLQRRRAKKYSEGVMAQRTGPVTVHEDYNDGDLTMLRVPQEAVGFVTGRAGNFLRTIEEEWGTLMFFVEVESSRSRSKEYEKLAIFGDVKARRGAELKVLSAVETKVPGYFEKIREEVVSRDKGCDYEDGTWGTDTMQFQDDELSYALGKQGGTRKKIERSSGAIVQYVGQNALFSGCKAERRRAKEYMKWLFNQLEGPVYVDGWEDRDDITVVDVPQDCIGYVTGNRRAALGGIEEEWGTLMFFMNKDGQSKGQSRGRGALLGDDLPSMGASRALVQAYEQVKKPLTAANRIVMLITLVSTVFIFINFVCTGVALDYLPGWWGWKYVDSVFGFFFIVETLLKLFAVGWREYCCGAEKWWNFFDSGISLVALVELVYNFIVEGLQNNMPTRVALTLRVLRLARVSFYIKLINTPLLQELANIVQGFLVAVPSLFWVLVTLSVVVYVSALALRATVLNISGKYYGPDVCGSGDLLDFNTTLPTGCGGIHDVYGQEYCGTVLGCMFTIFRCMIGDCTTAGGRSLTLIWSQGYGVQFDIFYSFSMVVVIFGMFNIITAIFVEATMNGLKETDAARKYAQAYESNYMTEQLGKLIMSISKHVSSMRKAEGAVAKLAKSFSWTSKDSDSSLNKEMFLTEAEFIGAIRNTDVRMLLDDLDVILEPRPGVFEAFNTEEDGTVSMSELVAGLLSFRGELQKVDVLTTKKYMENMTKELHDVHNLQSQMIARIVQIEQQPKQPQMPVERPPETSRRMVVAVPRRRIPKW